MTARIIKEVVKVILRENLTYRRTQNDEIDVFNKDLTARAVKQERKCTTNIFRQNFVKLGRSVKQLILQSRKKIQKELQVCGN